MFIIIDMNKKFYTVAEVAEILKVHWQSIHNYIKRGELEAVRLGRGYRISEQALNDFIKSKTTRKKK